MIRLATCLSAIAAAALPLSAPLMAQESLADLESFRSGCQALADGRFETASRHFEATWKLLLEGGAGDLERDFVASRLLESFVLDENTSAAVSWMGENPTVSSAPRTLRWSAIALQSEGRYSEAETAYASYISSRPVVPPHLLLQRAVCMALSGRPAEAFEIASRDITPESAKDHLELARIANLAKHPKAALTYLNAAENTGELPPNLHFPAASLRINSLAQLNRNAEAIDVACNLIDSSADAAQAHQAFLLLEEIDAGPVIRSLKPRFRKWEESPDHPAAEAAAFFSVILSAPPGDLPEVLESIANEDTTGPFADEARLRLLELAPTSQPDWATSLSPDANVPGGPDRHSYIESITAYRRDEFNLAARQFLNQASGQTGENRFRNDYNAAVAFLQDGDFEAFSSAYDELSQANPRSKLLADLSYLGGLFLASRGDPNAFEHLQTFIREHSDHPSNVEARLAFSEIHLNQVPARPQAAREVFEGLRIQPLTLEQSERLDYTAIWVEVTDNNILPLINLTKAFIRDWPGSTYLPEIATLLGHRYLREKKHEDAREIFLSIARHSPNSPYAESARFFAAKSAPQSEEAISEWRDIAQSESDLAKHAQHELSMLLLSLDRFDDARAELQNILESSPEDSSHHYAAMADLGFISYVEGLTKDYDETLLTEAAAQYARLSNLPGAPASWRYNAAVRRAKCLEALYKPRVALEIYRSIVAGETEPSNILEMDTSRLEKEWVFRAGFSAINILKQNEDWAGAIKIADVLSLKEGARAIEASRLAEQMRLKYWVWD